MSQGPAGQSCPSRFPIFPLRGVVLLPGGNLPLNIFEPRYLQMVRDAMQTDRVIGMVQPRRDDDPAEHPEIFTTGCAGVISNFAETDDGRYLITLTGLSRFDVAEELEAGTPYRQVTADFSRWHADQQPAEPPQVLRDGLLGALRRYFAAHEIRAEWGGIESAPLAGLVTSLSMICPFAPSEKQALLEAADLERRTRILTALLQMDTAQGAEGERVRH